jgi:glycosyltransferase involved in cell wall biosynthesis
MIRWAPAVSNVVGVSHFVLDAHGEIFAHARQHLIRHPVVPPALRPLRPPGERLQRLGYIGQVHAIKGVRELIAAAPGLARRGITVTIAGKGRFWKEAAAAAERVPGVEYVGFVSGPQKEDFLESCDAGIVPSIWNEPGGPSYTALEWLCAGRPVLTSGRGGLGEGLDLVSGSIVIEPTESGIVEAVDRLLDRSAWTAAVANVAPVSGEGEYERWTDAYERVYEGALAGPRSAQVRSPRPSEATSASELSG